MRAWIVKSGRGWLPADDVARDLHDRMGVGELAEFSVLRPRSVPWNRMYWSICRTIGENQDPPRDEDSIDSELRILAGHFDVMYFEGREVRVPKRLAFDRMDADEWRDYWQKVEVAISERFGPTYVVNLGNAA